MATASSSVEDNREMDEVLIDQEEVWEGFKGARKSWDGSVVTTECICELLEYFCSHNYRTATSGNKSEIVLKRCFHLLGKDYEFNTVRNDNGVLCNHYPSELLVPIHEKDVPNTAMIRHPPGVDDLNVLREMFVVSRTARCRSRFVVPVILLQGHTHICRSATLATYAELCSRQGYDWLASIWNYQIPGSGGPNGRSNVASTFHTRQDPPSRTSSQKATSEMEEDVLTKTRLQDIKLLKTLHVKMIADLMVENKKIKYGIAVSSSEKVDRSQRYCDFAIASMPYPGCEFFRDYKSKGYKAENLKFNWNQSEVDAELSLPPSVTLPADIDPLQHHQWDLVEITQNYLRVMLAHLSSDSGGLLIHCISGWDRTPLFTSLLRLSLWADGLVHKTLTPPEIAYYTIAYDWFLFGHQLSDRLSRGEDILYFCFDFLKYICDSNFECNVPQRESAALNVSVGLDRHTVFDTSSSRRRVSHTSGSDSSVEDLTTVLCREDTAEHTVAAPLTINNKRQENEMDDSVGSWQVLSVTDAPVASLLSSSLSPHEQPRNGEIPNGIHQDNPPASKGQRSSLSHTPSGRRERLLSVRDLVLSVYECSIQPNNEGPSGSLGNLFNKLTSLKF